MNNTLISREDIKSVADSLNIKVSEEQIMQLMNDYPNAQADDENSLWFEVVESMLYNLAD